MIGYIYKIVFPNGKHYIGLTTRPLKYRYQQHKNCAKDITNTQVLYNALRKYDMVDMFELVEVDTAETVDELCEKEIEYIQIYNSYYNNEHGYNMTLGGEGCNGYVFTDEDKQKMSERGKQRFIDNPEERQKCSESQKKYHADNPEARIQHGEKLKKHYEDNPDARQKCSESHKKYHADNPDAGKQMSEKKKQYYEDNPDAGKQHGEKIKQYYIDNPDAGKQMSEKKKQYFIDNPDAGKKHGEKTKQHYIDNPEARRQHGEKMKKHYEDNPEARQKCSESQKKRFTDNPEEIKKRLDKLGHNKPFDVFKKDGTFVKTFTYQIDARKYLQREYNITQTIKIGEVLRGTRMNSAGFVFKYK